jgi:RNA polymerase sigma-70 factor (ECF subfamily)
MREERDELIRAAVAQLPERDAEILLLKYSEGWSCRELTAYLGIGQSAVEARLHRARDRLRRCLQRLAVEGD